MPIVDRNGRPRSVRTTDESDKLLRDDIERLPQAEQVALLEMLDQLQSGEVEDFDAVAQVEYEHAPVDVRTFLTNPYFLGETGSSLWPKLVDDMVDLFEGGYHEAVLGGSIGWGKSFFATTALAYVLYQMSCLRSPQKAYGIDAGSHIYVAMLSVTEKVARRVVVNELIGKIAHSRYFKEKFPPTSAPSLLEIRFPKQIQAVAGSTGSSAIIGLNAFAGFIDETSFMGGDRQVDRQGRFVVVDKGEAIYKSIVRRMKSRFQKVGRLPGLMILASSKERPVAFVEKRIQQAREQKDVDFYVREYATWDVKPKEDFTGKTFKVVAGNERVQSRLLVGERADEDEARFRDMGLQIVEVPMEYRPDFERDLDGSLRDIAGIATLSVSPFVQRTEKIYDAFQEARALPLGGEGEEDQANGEWTPNVPLIIQWGKIAVQHERRIQGGYTEEFWVPKRRPDAPRMAHIDLALTKDSAGVAIAHIAGWTEVERRDAQLNEYNELAPIIETDLLLRIIPPPGDEIDLGAVRAIIYQFVDHGFNIRFVSCDQYQSADTLQQMRKRGIEADVVSVDKTPEPYETCKATIYEDRMRGQYHPWLIRELSQIQRIPRASGRGYKIDHPAIGPDGLIGSKDVADALAAVTFKLTELAPSMPLAPMSGVADRAAAEPEDHSWVTDGKTIIKQESGRVGQRGGIVGTRPVDPGSKPMPFVKG